MQAVIRERIDKFKKLLIATLERHTGFVVDATAVPLRVNGEPLLIGTRVDYCTALACEYRRRYQDESQRSGHVGCWDHSTAQVERLCDQLFW